MKKMKKFLLTALAALVTFSSCGGALADAELPALHDVQLRLLGLHRVHARGVCAGGVDYRRFLPI